MTRYILEVLQHYDPFKPFQTIDPGYYNYSSSIFSSGSEARAHAVNLHKNNKSGKIAVINIYRADLPDDDDVYNYKAYRIASYYSERELPAYLLEQHSINCFKLTHKGDSTLSLPDYNVLWDLNTNKARNFIRYPARKKGD